HERPAWPRASCEARRDGRSTSSRRFASRRKPLRRRGLRYFAARRPALGLTRWRPSRLVRDRLSPSSLQPWHDPPVVWLGWRARSVGLIKPFSVFLSVCGVSGGDALEPCCSIYVRECMPSTNSAVGDAASVSRPHARSIRRDG